MDDFVHNDTARRFIAALRMVEQRRDLESMVELFTDESELSKLDGQGTRRGQDGAREFWGEYRESFDEIKSTIVRATEGENAVALEWHAEGTLPGGRDFSYTGVSVVDIDGERVTGFRTYYDSAAFVAEPAAGVAEPAAG